MDHPKIADRTNEPRSLPPRQAGRRDKPGGSLMSAGRREKCGGSLALALAVWALAANAMAGDWPQVLGPHRDGRASGERITTAWPADGPKTLWQRPVGRGFSGPVVAQGVLVLFHRVDDEEVVEGLDAATGKALWKAPFPAEYVPIISDDDGPRAVPVIHEGRVYAYGAQGRLHCLDLKTGRKVWSRDTFADFNSKRPFHGEPPEGYFGLGSSPIVEGDKLLVNVGGDEAGAGIVAFSLDSGKTVWKSTRERASYSAPVAATVDGTRHVFFVTRLSVVSIDPADGSVRFQFPFGRAGPTVNAASPVVLDGHLFLTASYGIGAVWAEFHEDRADVLWRDPELVASQYTTPVELDGCLIGVDGRQDGPPADLVCIDPVRREVRWRELGFGYATLVKAGNVLLVQKTDGELVALAADTSAYRRLARASIFDAETRALPALSDGQYFVRDTRTLKCLGLRAGDNRR